MTLLVPPGTRLLHIGPAKTGTTSLQSAFDRARPALTEHRVHYAGDGAQPRAAAGAVVTGRRVPGHSQGVEAWPELVAEVRESDAHRVVISSETFARAGDKGAARVIEGFGADCTRVVITIRPLVDMLSSSWQQFVQTGSVLAYQDWLAQMLDHETVDARRQPQFWRKTRIDALARRWGGLVGPDNVTVVSLGGRPRDFVLHVFEEMVGLPAGMLVSDEAAANVSLGLGTAELIRRFNQMYAEHEVGDAHLRARLIEFGSVRHLRGVPGALAADARIDVPQWAADRATQIADEMNEGVRASGVRVVGDLDALLLPSRAPVPQVGSTEVVNAESAAALLFGMMRAAMEQGRQRGVWAERKAVREAAKVEAAERAADLRAAPEAFLDTLATAELARYLRRRLARRTLRRLRGR